MICRHDRVVIDKDGVWCADDQNCGVRLDPLVVLRRQLKDATTSREFCPCCGKPKTGTWVLPAGYTSPANPPGVTPGSTSDSPINGGAPSSSTSPTT